MKSKRRKDRGGRPSKLTAPLREAILGDVRHGLGQDAAAARNGIHRHTMSRWIKEIKTFEDEIEKAKTQFENDQLLIIREAAINRYTREGVLTRRGSWQAAAWLLERTRSDQYALKWQGELGGHGGKPLIPESVPQVDTSRFTKDQLDKLITATTALMVVPTPTQSVIPGNGHSNGDNGTP